MGATRGTDKCGPCACLNKQKKPRECANALAACTFARRGTNSRHYYLLHYTIIYTKSELFFIVAWVDGAQDYSTGAVSCLTGVSSLTGVSCLAGSSFFAGVRVSAGTTVSTRLNWTGASCLAVVSFCSGVWSSGTTVSLGTTVSADDEFDTKPRLL